MAMEFGREQDPGITANLKVLQLASVGNIDELGLSRSARFKSDDPRIRWILCRQVEPSKIGGCDTIIKYVDNTDYRISWNNACPDEFWSVEHHDRAQERGEQPERILPFTGGIKRIDYTSDRFSRLDSSQNLQDVGHAVLAASEKFDDLADKFLLDLNDPMRSNVLSKSINPADLDIAALFAPLLSIDEIRDRLYYSEPDEPERFKRNIQVQIEHAVLFGNETFDYTDRSAGRHAILFGFDKPVFGSDYEITCNLHDGVDIWTANDKDDDRQYGRLIASVAQDDIRYYVVFKQLDIDSPVAVDLHQIRNGSKSFVSKATCLTDVEVERLSYSLKTDDYSYITRLFRSFIT